MISQHIPLKKKLLLLAILLFLSVFRSLANGGGEAPVPSAMENPVVITMVVIMLVLLLAIALLSFVVLGAMDIYRDKMKKEDRVVPIKQITTGALLLLFNFASAQDTGKVKVVAYMLEGVSNTAFYTMVSIIILELLILMALLYNLRVLLGMDRPKVFSTTDAPVKRIQWISIWRKLNDFKPAEQEADILLDHSYDGIHELDNRLPPWWLYGFYVCIVVGVVYMWRFHVSHSGSSSQQEYQYAMLVGEEQKQAYLKNAASKVDENNVVYLNDGASLDAGKSVFVGTCAACHGKGGEGGVGPNLTDDYWLHGGSIKDVFKTIKYGWPDKGMRSWQDDYSPRQLAQIASYVKSIRGSNPANPKEKQGEFYKEETAMPDSTKLAVIIKP